MEKLNTQFAQNYTIAQGFFTDNIRYDLKKNQKLKTCLYLERLKSTKKFKSHKFKNLFVCLYMSDKENIN